MNKEEYLKKEREILDRLAKKAREQRRKEKKKLSRRAGRHRAYLKSRPIPKIKDGGTTKCPTCGKLLEIKECIYCRDRKALYRAKGIKQ